MACIYAKDEMSVKVIPIDFSGWVVVKHYQVIGTIASKAVVGKVMMDISETPVGRSRADWIKSLPNKVSRFGTLQHIAVHTIGS